MKKSNQIILEFGLENTVLGVFLMFFGPIFCQVSDLISEKENQNRHLENNAETKLN